MPTNAEYTVIDLIKSSQEKNAVEFNKAIDHILQTKATQAIERKREEVAQNMFNTEVDNEDDDIEIDDVEIDDEDALDDADIEIDDEEDQSDSDEDTEEDIDDSENKDA